MTDKPIRQEQGCGLHNDITVVDLRNALAALAKQIQKMDPSFDFTSIEALRPSSLGEVSSENADSLKAGAVGALAW